MPEGRARGDGRTDGDIREISFETGFQPSPDGSALISWGETRVLCSATIENRVPPFIAPKSGGWVTAEYDMLPGSGNRRVKRDRSGAPKGRSQEIQRLIGRSLRQTLDLSRIPDRTITIDCDVLVADGGTRVAAITGGAVALRLALKRMLTRGDIETDPWKGFVGALSIGLVDGRILADLTYEEDSKAEMDMNVVCLSSGLLVELQASAEHRPVHMETVMDMAGQAVSSILGYVIPSQKLAAGD
ncbi:MAG TPA: ribonuclease PH [Candidatus Fermentibacter daniensis]|jgi:ribonuclease PH|nr:MAG: hypothetical protein AO394_06380 [Candidatus Fermentibacter daniensis]MBP7720535.1 ribonuclease PH [Candidatus Fermentibacter sp.]KZD19091.1 MAG: hypothetical protein AO395_00900 [Candidatus Fermentibacter daniensis]MCC6872469.1 ribonuclease PH [Candidatus Fermentibacter sp.]HOD18696.1 ribonuclease PH [Candidatus Fermentibacter daniensis]